MLATTNGRSERIEAMSQYRPINDDHAVENVDFQLIFDGNVAPALFSLAQANHHEWREELPALQVGALQGVEGLPATFTAGLAFSYLRPDGSPAWQMRFDPQTLTVTCGRYTRWVRVWSDARSLLEKALGLFAKDESLSARKIAAIRLQVGDRFEVPETEWSPDGLLRRDGEYLPLAVFGAGAVWHNNTGWFEQEHGLGAILHNLNVASSRKEALIPTSSLITIGLTHLQELRVKDHVDVSAALETLDAIMEHFHQSNKQLVSKVLVEAACDQIGLWGTKRGE
ncbi:hypothetical protein [Novosphingobium sp.]|uniref:hypothetical protein n=1 Tax=Novosphingobium sp. TaxID=1874826 RepID=UPI002B4A829F|nr:hypothetical protein [Novosphingobium sp.]HKR92649.1 hypothetical protein [Novosphingobium sp.]